MARQSRSIPRRAAAALGFIAVLAACSGGDGEGTTPSPAKPAGPEPVAPSPPPAQPGVLRTITHWAGAPDPGGRGDPDGMGSAARFRQPEYVAVGSDGSVWVVETGASRIRRIDPKGQVSTVLDAAAHPPVIDVDGRQVPFSFPGALVAAPEGGVFVAMQQSSVRGFGLSVDGPWAVLHVAPGVPPRAAVLPAPAQRLSDPPTGLALDSQGRLYMAMACGLGRSDRTVMGTTQPRSVLMLHAACGTGPAANGITRLALDAEDRALLTLSNGDVQRLERDLRVTPLGRTSAGNSFRCAGMAADRRGGLLLTGGTSALLRLDASGQEQVVAGSLQEGGWADGPAQTARFATLCGVAVDGQGHAVVVDAVAHTVRRIAPDGSVTTLAGRALQSGYRDGSGRDALFGSYFSIGPGVGDEVVVADPSNHAVREVDARQRVRTRVGLPQAGSELSADGPVATARLGNPTAALKTADGSLWVADGTRLLRLGADNMLRTVAASAEHAQALAMALDRAGDVLVAWGSYNVSIESTRVRHHLERYSARNPAAAPLRLDLHVPEELAGQLNDRPVRGLCTLPDGSLVYTQQHAVLRRSAGGAVELLAGSPDQAGATEGTGTAARFHWPGGLACDATGGVYVADGGNHAVRYIDAQRQVRTVLGTLGQAGHRVDALPGLLHGGSSLALVPGGLVVATGMGLLRAGF